MVQLSGWCLFFGLWGGITDGQESIRVNGEVYVRVSRFSAIRVSLVSHTKHFVIEWVPRSRRLAAAGDKHKGTHGYDFEMECLSGENIGIRYGLIRNGQRYSANS